MLIDIDGYTWNEDVTDSISPGAVPLFANDAVANAKVGRNVDSILGFIVNVSTLNNTLPLSKPSYKSSNIIDAKTDDDTAYAGPDAADEEGIKKIVLLKSIESLLNTAL